MVDSCNMLSVSFRTGNDNLLFRPEFIQLHCCSFDVLLRLPTFTLLYGSDIRTKEEKCKNTGGRAPWLVLAVKGSKLQAKQQATLMELRGSLTMWNHCGYCALLNQEKANSWQHGETALWQSMPWNLQKPRWDEERQVQFRMLRKLVVVCLIVEQI